MNLPELCIRRPVMTTLVMASLLFFGLLAFRQLPVNDLPNVDFPTINVSATLPGASAETMAASVAGPLERQFSTIAGVDNMTSSSTLGQTSITLQFSLDRNLDGAAQDVQAAISRALKSLPADMPAPPSFSKVNPADSPVFYLALSSSQLPLYEVDRYAETMVAQRLSQVSGVAQVSVYGAQKYAVRVRVSPEALARHGLTLDDVAKAIGAGNTNLPVGVLEGSRQEYTLRTNGQLDNAAAYRRLVVAWRNGFPIRLGEVGRVEDSVENDRVASWYRDTRAIVLAVQRQPGTNTVAVVDGIRRLLPHIDASLPPSVQTQILFDRSASIRQSVHDVETTLLLAAALVVMIIFLFLRRARATAIPSLAMPLSVVGTFGAMYLLGYSLNNLTLMALTLSVGFVVDDAIVMLENIVRHVEMGKTPLRAALDGSREIGFTILSMTLSLVAVFVPVLFMGGVVGKLMHEFAVTISVAVLVSGFVSLTLTPMMSARLVRPESEERHGRLFTVSERMFQGLLDAYRRSLDVVLRHRLATLGVFGLTVVASAWMFATAPKGFLPTEDTGQIFAFTQAAPGTSFEAMKARQQAVAAIVLKDPAVEGFMSAVGAGGASAGTSEGRMFIHLKPFGERPPAQKIIQHLRAQVAQVPGIQVFFSIPPTIRLGGKLTKSLYQYTLQGNSLAELYTWAPKLEAKLRTIPGLIDVTSDLQNTDLQLHVAIERDRAAALGITPQQVEQALSYAYGTRQVSTIFTPSDDYEVILGVDHPYQSGPQALSQLYIRAANGQLVPLETVVRWQRGSGPLSVNHQGQLPAVTLSFDLAPGMALSDAVARISQAEREMGLPATITTSFQGTAQAFEQSTRNLGWLLLVAVVVIYVVLGILYESFIHPLTILSGLPAAAVGALLALRLFGIELSVIAFVGMIMLVGIVKKNAIMMVDFAIDAQRERGAPPLDAIREACLLRFRPIMMTTMAALMGTLPIALALGAGAESRQPLGIAVVGGLLFSQFLTLYITPVIYLYFETLRERWFPGSAAGSSPPREALAAREGVGALSDQG